jgi:hypothetical protein
MVNLKTSDIIHFDCEESWFQAGLEYALISWTSTFNRMQKPNPYSRIQKIVLGIIAEKGFENFLKYNDINYETHGKTRWYEVDRYDIGISDYAVDVKANFLDLNSLFVQRNLPTDIDERKEWFLDCTALVPLDQFNPGKNIRRAHKRDKVYVFPFLTGFFSETTGSKYLIHTFWDYKWIKKAEYKNLMNLGYLDIKYTGKIKGNVIRIYGTTAKYKACIETVVITSESVRTQNNFFQVFSIQWIGDEPDGNLTIKSPTLGIKEKIYPIKRFELSRNEQNLYFPLHNDWQSLDFHNSTLYLLGWLDEEGLRVEGKKYPRFAKNIKQYQETKVDNWGINVSELYPIKNINNI